MIYVPDMFTDEEWKVLGVAFLLVCLWAVAFLTWALASGTVRVTNWFLEPRARSAEELAAAEDAGESPGALRATIIQGIIVGFGLGLGLLLVHGMWTALT